MKTLPTLLLLGALGLGGCTTPKDPIASGFRKRPSKLLSGTPRTIQEPIVEEATDIAYSRVNNTRYIYGNWPFAGTTDDISRLNVDGLVKSTSSNLTTTKTQGEVDKDHYIEMPDKAAYSVNFRGEMTIGFWMKPRVKNFASAETNDKYIHIAGKGEKGNQEWAFRMYNADSPTRPQRVSFYVFNLEGGLGIGSYFQEPIAVGEWVHVTGVIDNQYVRIYKNGLLKDKDQYTTTQGNIPPVIPRNGKAPLRIGTRDMNSFFEGTIKNVRLYSIALRPEEVKELYESTKPE